MGKSLSLNSSSGIVEQVVEVQPKCTPFCYFETRSHYVTQAGTNSAGTPLLRRPTAGLQKGTVVPDRNIIGDLFTSSHTYNFFFLTSC